MKCTRCDGTGFLNDGQIPEDVRDRDHEGILRWMQFTEMNHDISVCDCCGDGNYWYGTPGEHYGPDDPRGDDGPYAYNGGLCECH